VRQSIVYSPLENEVTPKKKMKTGTQQKRSGRKSAVATLIQSTRRDLGLSRKDLAQMIGVDPTTIRGWEQGIFRPRDGKQRVKLAQALKLDLLELSGAVDARHAAAGCNPRLVETLTDFPILATQLLRKTRTSLKDLRLASPYVLPAFTQVDFRRNVAARLLDKTLEVQRIEIFYSLDRLREVLSNIIRYDGCNYHVRSFCPGLREVVPALGAYAFDDNHLVLGGYFVSVPPHGRPGLYIKGDTVRQFFSAYWDEIWRRGTPLNLGGAAELSSVRDLALALGLRDADWPAFVDEAKKLDSVDGAPHRI
jgi:DNA-binding transcriptional regulator YiaG